ncbi:MAG: DnaD domain protein [Chloroflexi bacterium]|nr:DnaD domain protein [Chloroflexota bacterium]
MTVFSGFPSGKLTFARLPDLFFSELLPQIDHLAELKVTLHIFWLLQGKKGSLQYVTLRELLGDGTLLRGLQGIAPSPEEALREGLARAVARGTLLHLVGVEDGEQFYFVNSAQGRRTVEQIQLGEIQLAAGGVRVEPAVPTERPNIFILYEQNIGLLQPIIAEELEEAERTYPQEWIEEAFRIAVERNVRNWKYVRRILERWATEGKDEGRGKIREKTWYTEEEYRKYIKR